MNLFGSVLFVLSGFVALGLFFYLRKVRPRSEYREGWPLPLNAAGGIALGLEQYFKFLDAPGPESPRTSLAGWMGSMLMMSAFLFLAFNVYWGWRAAKADSGPPAPQ